MLLREINIWENQNDNEVVRYKCFEVLGKEKYCVLKADWFRLPLNENDIKSHEKTSLELLIDSDPTEVNKLFNNIQDAINNFKEDFKNL